MYESFTALDIVQACKMLREYGDCASLFPEKMSKGARAALWTVYSPDCTLMGIGPGGYPTAYYLLNHNGWSHEGEVLCANCANDMLKRQRTEFRAIAEHTGNSDYEGGLCCDECSQWIVEPNEELSS